MRRGPVLLLGLVFLIGLFAYAAFFTAPAIQADIQDRTSQVLAAAGVDFADVDVNGRDVVITGAAPDNDVRQEVVSMTNGLRGVRLVRDEMTVLDPPVSPFTFSAFVGGDGVSLSGFVPDEATKTALVEKARSLFSGAVNDDTIIARGAPDGDWGQAVAAALEQLAALENGELTVEDTTIGLAGALESESQAAALESALIASLPEGYAFQPGFEVPPPLIVDEPAPTDLGADDAQAAADGGEQTGAPADGAGDGVGQTADQDPGDTASGEAGADATDTTGTPDGATDTDGASEADAASEAGDEQTAALAGQDVGTIIEDPQACQDELDALLADRTIQFASASAVISLDSYDLLNEIGEVAVRCEGSSIAIEGHTDSTGTLQSNIDLSLARAEAILEFLVGLGIDRSRLSAIGYGPTLPVASNETDEGKAKNRRIEFKVEQ